MCQEWCLHRITARNVGRKLVEGMVATQMLGAVDHEDINYNIRGILGCRDKLVFMNNWILSWLHHVCSLGIYQFTHN